MMVIPFQISERAYNVFILLEDENVQRIKKYDPAQWEPKKMGGIWSNLRLNTVLIGYANAVDAAKVLQLAQSGKTDEALKMLSRGFEFRPDLGDHDNPYESVQR